MNECRAVGGMAVYYVAAKIYPATGQMAQLTVHIVRENSSSLTNEYLEDLEKVGFGKKFAQEFLGVRSETFLRFNQLERVTYKTGSKEEEVYYDPLSQKKMSQQEVVALLADSTASSLVEMWKQLLPLYLSDQKEIQRINEAYGKNNPLVAVLFPPVGSSGEVEWDTFHRRLKTYLNKENLADFLESLSISNLQ